jgi:hypothetical protein
MKKPTRHLSSMSIILRRVGQPQWRKTVMSEAVELPGVMPSTDDAVLILADVRDQFVQSAGPSAPNQDINPTGAGLSVLGYSVDRTSCCWWNCFYASAIECIRSPRGRIHEARSYRPTPTGENDRCSARGRRIDQASTISQTVLSALLGTLEVIFRRLFDYFRCVSQTAASYRSPKVEDAQPWWKEQGAAWKLSAWKNYNS